MEQHREFSFLIKSHFSAGTVAEIKFILDLFPGQPVFGSYLESPLILLKELSYQNPQIVSGLLLYRLCKETAVLGDLKNYQKFLPTATWRIRRLSGPKTARLVVNAIKPEIDSVSFKTKQDIFDYHAQKLNEDAGTLLIKMIDKLREIRAYTHQETIRGQKDPRPTNKGIEKFAKRLDEFYLPLLDSKISMAENRLTNMPPALLSAAQELRKKICTELSELQRLSSNDGVWFFPVKYDQDELEYIFHPEKQAANNDHRNNPEALHKPRLFLANRTFFDRLAVEKRLSIKTSQVIDAI